MTSSSENSIMWISKSRNYNEETKKTSLKSTVVPLEMHPLKPFIEESQNKMTRNASKSSVKNYLDPLSEALLDPLSKMVADVSFKEKQELQRKNEIQSSFEPWSFKKSSILSKYTTVEKLSITSSFLSPIAGAVNNKAIAAKSLTTSSDKIKDRLQQLEQFDDENMQEMANLSQQDYIKRIDELNNALLRAWNEDDRVKSLKIVIQCAKLLSDSSVVQFYPSKFVLITDILDTFGKLVYERISTKSFYVAPGSSKPQPLPEKFTADIVPPIAKETCRNWFFKIASIRELLPRIYVEASILKCTNFLSDDYILKPIQRLISMAAGIGDPLVATYVNCYICRVGVSIDSNIREYQLFSLENTLYIFRKITNEKFNRLIVNQTISFKNYLELYCPAIDWILQCVCNNRTSEYLNGVLDKFVQVSNENQIVNGLLINSMMSSFEPAYITSIAHKIVEMIKDSDEEYFSKHLLFQKLGMCLVFNSSSVDKEDKEKSKKNLQLLNEVWKVVTTFTEPAHYMSCAEIWIEFTLKNFTKKEINTLLGDIVKHVQPDRIFEKFYPQLQSIVSKILVYVTDFSLLFSMDKFMKFISLIQKDFYKIEVCKSITNAFLKSANEFSGDIVVINSMMQICKSMHDFVNALTLDDEKREISQLICAFINKIEVTEKDKIEQYLNFYSDFRASFSNLDDVIALLVHVNSKLGGIYDVSSNLIFKKVNYLAMETLKIVNFNHTRKTGSFVRACVAYSFITIPSLSNFMLKLQLYLESAQVAVLNQCLSQADAFIKSAISLIPEIQRHLETQNATNLSIASLNFDGSNASKMATISISTVEKYLFEYLSSMLSTMLIIPDNPEQGVLYLFTGVFNLINKHFNWENLEYKIRLLAQCLILLSAIKQESYLHHINNVELNDKLYGSDAKFFKEVNRLIDQILDDIFLLLKTMVPLKQSQLALEIFNQTISHADLDHEASLSLAVNLWNLSLKNQSLTKFHEQLAATLKLRAKSKPEYKKLLNQLHFK